MRFRAVGVVVSLVVGSFGFVGTLSQPAARASTGWYVASSGSDGNSCVTPASPCATIDGAIAKASPIDVIYITAEVFMGSGGYAVTVDKDLTISGGWDSLFLDQIGRTVVDGNDQRMPMWVNPGTVNLDHLEIRGAPSGPNAALQVSGEITITDSVVTANAYVGIHMGKGTLTVQNSTVDANGDRGIESTGGDVLIVSSTVSNNSDTGIYMFGGIPGSLTVVNSTISGNTGSHVGGIRSSGGDVTLVNSTVTDNTGSAVPTGLGGIEMYIGGTAHLANSIVFGNHGQRLGASDCVIGTGAVGVSEGFNVWGNCSGVNPLASDTVGVDPMLGPLADNGGPTATHAIAKGSIAIDHGNPAPSDGSLETCTDVDQRGIERPQGARCDAGSFEAVAGSIYGTITTSGAAPLQDICVEVLPAWARDSNDGSIPILGSATTAADGTYATDVGPGAYLLLFYDCGSGGAAYEYYSNRNDFGEADTLEIDSNQAVLVDVTLETAGSISGTVHNVTPDPIAGVDIYVTDAWGLVVAWDTTAADGTYHIPGLRAGTPHYVVFFDTYGTYATEFFDDQSYFDLSDPVYVTAGVDTSNIDAEMRVPPGGRFVDDDGNFHEPMIEAIAEAGITTGCGDDPPRYCPGRNVTRAEMAAFALRMIGEDENLPSYQGYFPDVPEGAWYTPYVERLYELGITNGCAEAPLRYCPTDPVRRSEMSAYLLRTIGEDSDLPTYQGYFADVPEGAWYAPYVERLYELGITTGCASPPLSYCPLDNVTRDQMASFIGRTLGLDPIPLLSGAPLGAPDKFTQSERLVIVQR